MIKFQGLFHQDVCIVREEEKKINPKQWSNKKHEFSMIDFQEGKILDKLKSLQTENYLAPS